MYGGEFFRVQIISPVRLTFKMKHTIHKFGNDIIDNSEKKKSELKKCVT